jgi:hypothetical protein
MWNPTKAVSRTLQVTFAGLSIVLFISYLFLLINLHVPIPPSSIWLVALFPLPYWAFCAFTSFAIRPGRFLVTLGIAVHGALVPLIVWFLLHGAALLAVFFCGYGLLWYLVYITRRAEQIVGPERRQLASQLNSSGTA